MSAVFKQAFRNTMLFNSVKYHGIKLLFLYLQLLIHIFMLRIGSILKKHGYLFLPKNKFHYLEKHHDAHNGSILLWHFHPMSFTRYLSSQSFWIVLLLNLCVSLLKLAYSVISWKWVYSVWVKYNQWNRW